MDYTENLLEAISIIADSKVNALEYNKTLVCTIVDNSDKDDGKYIVTDGSTKFTAYSDTKTYTNDTEVYVSVLNGDMKENKIIIGKKVSSENSTPYVFEQPLDSLVDCTGNLIEQDLILEELNFMYPDNVFDGGVGLLANDPDLKSIIFDSRGDQYYTDEQAKALSLYYQACLEKKTRNDASAYKDGIIEKYKNDNSNFTYNYVINILSVIAPESVQIYTDLNITKTDQATYNDYLLLLDICEAWENYNDMSNRTSKDLSNFESFLTNGYYNLTTTDSAGNETIVTLKDGLASHFQEYTTSLQGLHDYYAGYLKDTDDKGKFLLAYDSTYSRLGFQTYFKTFLQKAISGDYGVKIVLYDKVETKQGWNRRVHSINELELNSVDDMYGNPYNYESYYKQAKLFDIEDLGIVTGYKVIFYQVPETFKDKNGDDIKYQTDDKLKLPLNIYMKDSYLSFGYNISDFTSNYVKAYTLNNLYYGIQESEEAAKREVKLKWIYVDSSGKATDMQKNESSSSRYEIQWFQYDKKHGTDNTDAGIGWIQEKIYNETDSASDAFSYIFTPDKDKNTEQIKVIVYCDYDEDTATYKTVLKTDILTFTNKVTKSTEGIVDDSDSLSIVCEDGTNGNYLCYDDSNALIDSSQGSATTRTLACHFDDSSLGETASGLLQEAYSIEWVFPASKTMIRLDSSLFNYDTKVASGTNVSYNSDDDTVRIIRYGSDLTSESNMNIDNTISPYQTYHIYNYLSEDYGNNTIYCYVIKWGQKFQASKQCVFGQQGTAGTDSSLVLNFDNSQIALLAKETTNKTNFSVTADKNKIILLSDSYGESPDAENNWISKFKAKIKNDSFLSQYDYYFACQSGAGLGGYTPILIDKEIVAADYKDYLTNDNTSIKYRIKDENGYPYATGEYNANIDYYIMPNFEELIYRVCKKLSDEDKSKVISIIIGCGFNDILNTEDNIKKQVREISEHISTEYKFNANAKVYLYMISNPTKIYTSSDIEGLEKDIDCASKIKTVKSIYASACSNYSNVEFIDIGTPFSKNHIQSDQIHPDASASQSICDKIFTETYNIELAKYNTSNILDSGIITAKLYDVDSKDITETALSDSSITFTWSTFKSYTCSNSVPIHYAQMDQRNKCQIYSYENTNINDLYIIQCTVSGYGDYDLTACITVPLRANRQYIDIKGPKKLIYSTSGIVSYYKDPYKLVVYEASKEQNNTFTINCNKLSSSITSVNKFQTSENKIETSEYKNLDEDEAKYFYKSTDCYKLKDKIWFQMDSEDSSEGYNIVAELFSEEITDSNKISLIFSIWPDINFSDGAKLKESLEKIKITLNDESSYQNISNKYNASSLSYSNYSNWFNYHFTEITSNFFNIIKTCEDNIKLLYETYKSFDDDNIPKVDDSIIEYDYYFTEGLNKIDDDAINKNKFYFINKDNSNLLSLINDNYLNYKSTSNKSSDEIKSDYEAIISEIQKTSLDKIITQNETILSILKSSLDNNLTNTTKQYAAGQTYYRIYNTILGIYLNLILYDFCLEYLILTGDSTTDSKRIKIYCKDDLLSFALQWWQEDDTSKGFTSKLTSSDFDDIKSKTVEISTDGSWNIYTPKVEEDNKTNSNINTQSYYPTINQYNKLCPVDMYIEDLPVFGVQCVVDKKIVWTQPIFYNKNKYFSSILNSWDGTALQMVDANGKNGSYVIANMIAAGKKNSDNTFSGVAMGDWSGNSGDGLMKQYTGLFGFNEGEMSFSLTTDGTATLGKATRGQLVLDGNSSTIQSLLYKTTSGKDGMILDFDNGYIDLANNSNSEEKHIILNSEAGLTGSGQNPIGILYPLQIGNKKDPNFYVEWDGSIRANNGQFSGIIAGSEICGSSIKGGSFDLVIATADTDTTEIFIGNKKYAKVNSKSIGGLKFHTGSYDGRLVGSIGYIPGLNASGVIDHYDSNGNPYDESGNLIITSQTSCLGIKTEDLGNDTYAILLEGNNIRFNAKSGNIYIQDASHTNGISLSGYINEIVSAAIAAAASSSTGT